MPPATPKVIVFAGDGQMISQWGRSVEAADVPSTMIVGVHRVSDEALRLREYPPKFDSERVAAHEKFFVHDVASWARLRFSVKLCLEHTAVFDVSAVENSRVLLESDTPRFYGAIFSASPGAGHRPAETMPSRLHRPYLELTS